MKTVTAWIVHLLAGWVLNLVWPMAIALCYYRSHPMSSDISDLSGYANLIEDHGLGSTFKGSGIYYKQIARDLRAVTATIEQLQQENERLRGCILNCSGSCGFYANRTGATP
jgi:hypothetical protein